MLLLLLLPLLQPLLQHAALGEQLCRFNETLPAGSAICRISNQEANTDCQGDGVGKEFHIQGGSLLLRQRIDRDSILACRGKQQCRISIACFPDNGEPVTFQLDLLDANDEAPVFVKKQLTAEIRENQDAGSTLRLEPAVDADSPSNARTRYRLIDSSGGIFSLAEAASSSSSESPNLVVRQRLDREKRAQYRLRLVAYDADRPQLSSEAAVLVRVLDVNDNPPKIRSGCGTVSINETAPVGALVTQIAATDADEGANAQLRYSLLPRSTEEHFSISSGDGRLRLRARLDYEGKPVHDFVVMVTDGLAEDSCSVTVSVMPQNDHAPKIVEYKGNQVLRIREGPHNSPNLILMHVKDADGDRVSCAITEGAEDFKLEQNGDGSSKFFKLRQKSSFDRENHSSVGVRIRCSDNGQPPLSSERFFNFTIEDINDNKPSFKEGPQRMMKIREGLPVGHFITIYSAGDDDQGENGQVTYRLLPPSIRDSFSILENGTILTKKLLDREQQESYDIKVVATDRGSPRLSSTAMLTLILTDINDCAPVFKEKQVLRVAEDASVGQVVGKIVATDADLGDAGRVQFQPTNDSRSGSNQAFHRKFQIDEAGVVRVKARLDREALDGKRYFASVVAKDSAPPNHSTTGMVTIIVEDVNDNSPKFLWPSAQNRTKLVPLRAAAGAVVANVVATDADQGANARLQYELEVSDPKLKELFGLDRSKGELRLLRQLLAAEADASFELLVRVFDSGQPRRNASAVLLLAVDKTLPPWPTAGRLTSSEINFLLIVIICSVTLVVSTVLVAAILFTRKRHAQQQAACNGNGYSCPSPDFGDRLGQNGETLALSVENGDTAVSLEHHKLHFQHHLNHQQHQQNHHAFGLRLHHCQLADCDPSHHTPTLNRMGLCRDPSGQSSESDSGRGTCLVEDDYREMPDPSRHITILPRSAAAMTSSAAAPLQAPGLLSTFTIDRTAAYAQQLQQQLQQQQQQQQQRQQQPAAAVVYGETAGGRQQLV